jgi:hypothetical protein
MKRLLFISIPFLLLSCAGTRSFTGTDMADQRSLADSMLADALDHEGLYALIDTIKPMSSIKYLSYPIAKDSTQGIMDHQVVKEYKYLDSVALYKQICEKLSNDKIRFVMIPFQQSYKGRRNIEIYAVNLYKFKSKLKEHAAFFGQFGITPDADPAQVITLIEYENKADRWRGYGYLFGYPAYAVDFFVMAGLQQDNGGEFVKRDFFQIPVYAGKQGYFTYAMPKGHQPGAVDSTLYNTASIALERYKKLRSKYVNEKGLDAIKLWKKASKK